MRRVRERAPTVFVSYSRRDMALVDRLDAGLRERGIEPLIDRSEIFAFEDWWGRIEGLIRQAETIVFVLSPDSVASEICLREIDFAQTLNKRLAPVVVRMVDPARVPAALSRLNFVFLDDDASFAAGLDRLAEGLSTDIDWVREHSVHGAQAQRWSDTGRPTALLLRSPQLELAESWIAARPANAPVPTPQTRDLITASRRAATGRRSFVTAALTIGLVLALALAGLAYWQRREAIAQREVAERNFLIARTTIDDVIFDLAQGLRQVDGVRISVLRTVLSRVEGAVDRLVRAAPESSELQRSRSVMLNEFGTTYLDAGEGAAALKAFEDSLAIMRGLLQRNAQDTFWQNDLSVTLSKLSDARLVMGDTGGALAAMDECVAIRRGLLRQKPDDLSWRRDLLIGLGKLGDVQSRSGQTKEALASFEEGLGIARDLVQSDPANEQWQRDLSFILSKIGEFRFRARDLSGALSVLEEDLAISRRLALRQPDSSEVQRGLSVSLEKIGDVRYVSNDSKGALAAYEECISIRRRLRERDPDNTGWRRDLSVSLDRLGVVKLDLGDHPGAFAAFEESAAIIRSLLARDPDNTQWQHDLSVSRDRVADAKLDAGDVAGALAAREESLELRRNLARKDPGNARMRRDVMVALGKIGELKLRTGDKAGASASYGESLKIARELVRLNPEEVLRQTDLVGALLRAASGEPERARQRELLRELIAILTDLEQAGRLPDSQKPILELARKTLLQP